FFQAEDGIRDRNVTGVQTCALPISWQLFIQKDPAKSINSEGFILSCPAGVSHQDQFICASQAHSWRTDGVLPQYIDTVFNYTGISNGPSTGSYTESNIITGGCASPCAFQRNSADIPGLNPAEKYYVGILNQANNAQIAV